MLFPHWLSRASLWHCDAPGIDSSSNKVDEASDSPLHRTVTSHITSKLSCGSLSTPQELQVPDRMYFVCSHVITFIIIIIKKKPFSHKNFHILLNLHDYDLLFVAFRSPWGSCSQSEPPPYCSGCFIMKLCHGSWCHLPKPASLPHSWLYYRIYLLQSWIELAAEFTSL